MAFLQRPARWMQLLASNSHAYSAAPNFAFELAVRKTSDDDMAGLDLSDVIVIATGSERVHPATLRRFTQRFARFNLRDAVIRPSYGLAEATVYVATRAAAQPPVIVRFDSEKLTAGKAERCESGGGTPLVSYGMPRSPMMRIVDPETRIECPAGTIGEIWVHGDNVAIGYWRKPHETEQYVRWKACRSVGRHTRGALAENRGLGIHLRRRAVHHRPHQGSLDRVWAQPLSRRHRGDDPGDHARPLRGDIGSG